MATLVGKTVSWYIHHITKERITGTVTHEFTKDGEPWFVAYAERNNGNEQFIRAFPIDDDGSDSGLIWNE